MSLKIGNRVKLLHDNLEGTIVSISEKEQIITIRTDDGFDMPVIISEVITTTSINYDNFNSEEDKKLSISESKDEEENKIDNRFKSQNIEQQNVVSENVPFNACKDLYIGILPENIEKISGSKLKIYFINDSDYDIGFTSGYQIQQKYYFLKRAWLPPKTKMLIKKFTQTDISKIKNFHFQVLYICNGEYSPIQPVDRYIDISAIPFYKISIYSDNEFFKSPSLVMPVNGKTKEEKLTDINPELLAKVMMEKNDIKIKEEKNRPKIVQREVDLHIESLIEEYNQLTPAEILKIQMEHFLKELDKGIVEGLEKIIFIHGVGNGQLKYEIRNELKYKYPDLSFQDASFKEYGYGATMVFLK